MFINTFYSTKNSTMHVWEQKNGKNSYFSEYWVPYVYLQIPIGDINTIDGSKAIKKEFESYNDYFTFNKEYHNNLLENKVKPEIQYLAEKYHNIPDNDIPTPKLKIYYIDIEVYSDKFPQANKAEDPVCLISVRDNTTGKTITFGEKEYSGNTENITYLHCPDESELLRKFFTYMYKHPPDVISGWNCNDFDLQYLINRDKLINNGKYYTALSPIRIVRTWESKKDNKKSINIDIAGVCILDYMELYKWYSPNKLERYSLEYVSQFELGKGKLDYSSTAKDLRELYHENWNQYVDYNIMDCQRVHELGQKLGYIRLIQSLSLLTRVPMRYYNAVTSLIEGTLLTYFRRNNMCAPYLEGGSQETFEAAYVKEPQKGMWNWLFSVDIQSSYPSHIITLNMSTETYYGRIIGMTEDSIIECVKRKEFPNITIRKHTGRVELSGKKLEKFNNALKRKLFSIAPCGTIFVNGKPGVLSTVEREMFEKRIETKKLMKQAKGSEREQFHAKQTSLKTILNSIYGVTSVPYSRYFNTDIAEAITSCGRHTVKSGEKFANELLNSMVKTNVDYATYGDTDSIAGDSVIYTKNGDMKIEDFFNYCGDEFLYNDDYNENYIKSVKESFVKTFKDGEVVYDKVKYVMKHKVFKKMFRIKCCDNEVIVTEDHSLIIVRDGKEMSVTPYDLKENDEIIKLL